MTNKSSIKPGAPEKNLRVLFIIFLLFTFIAIAGVFILKYSMAQKLDKLNVQLKQFSQETDLSNILLDLNSAENDFQQAGWHHQADKLAAYKHALEKIFGRIQAALAKSRTDSVQHFSGSKAQITRSFEQKMTISRQVFDLKHQFDSLLKVTTITSISAPLPDELKGTGPAKEKVEKLRIDTTVSTSQAASKNSLFKRLKDAVANRNQVKTVTIRQRQERDSASWLLIKGHRHSLGKLLQQLNRQNGRIQRSNEQLIAANLNLLAELHQVIQQLKDNDIAAWEKSRNDILRQYQSANNTLSKFANIAITLVLVFIVLLIVYMRKAGKVEHKYLLENERVVALARQKSELLATMSHEIRNPLTAITGTIYMLTKTVLSPDQEKKVASLKLSSALLMETINNILDVSKLEQQQTEVLMQVTFNPFQELQDAMDSMRFMAEKKGLLLKAEFTGDTETIVNGDALRLQQVMINLLSNAIKYTDEGSITVVAGIAPAGDQQKMILDVSIEDTGIGIPKEQQSGLFTRYYQAGGSQRKPGTGLGLYLCRQLINLQGGTIKIESEAGKGCTIRFTIPYQKKQ